VSPSFLPRDFVETEEGLLFAVVGSIEEGRVPACLRYRRSGSGYSKLSTRAAETLLRSTFREYLFYSKFRDVHLHAVPLERITHHYQPRRRVQELMTRQGHDAMERKLLRLLESFSEHGLKPALIGVTGSLLIGAQRPDSDIDLVIYGREPFFQAREVVEQLIQTQLFDPLDAALWRDAYARRACALSFEEYLWHERRKLNKAAIEGTKFDLSLLAEAPVVNDAVCHKQGLKRIQARVVDDTFAFDYPAHYGLGHPSIYEVLSFSATYVGQAQTGEIVDVCGQLEVTGQDRQRIVVGSNREAAGQYIKVVRMPER
jgi:uncharacterized protein